MVERLLLALRHLFSQINNLDKNASWWASVKSTADCGLRTRGKMQTTEFLIILCYFYYRVLTLNRPIQASKPK